MQIIIREACLENEDELTLLQDLLRTYFSEIGIAESDPKVFRLLNLKNLYQKPSCVFLVEANNKIVGCVCIKQLDQAIGEIQQLYVLKDFRKDGIGKRLLSTAVEYGLKVFNALRLDSRKDLMPAVRLYHSLGFYEIDRYNDNLHAEVFFEITKDHYKWCAREESNP